MLLPTHCCEKETEKSIQEPNLQIIRPKLSELLTNVMYVDHFGYLFVHLKIEKAIRFIHINNEFR